MCTVFKDVFGPQFKKVYDFLSKHYGAYKDEEWDEATRAMRAFKTPFEVDMVVALMNEIERVYEAALAGTYELSLSRKQSNPEKIYHPILEKVYRLAQGWYYTDFNLDASAMQKADEILKFVDTYSPFERELVKVCYKEFTPGKLAEDE